MVEPTTRYRYTGTAQTAERDEGLRAYMLKVYNYMASGVLLTGIVALFFGNMMRNNPELAQTLFGSPLHWVIMLAPLAFVMVMSFGLNKLSSGALQAIFWAFAATMGLSLSWILLAYTGESVARTFFTTAAAFGALSLYGYTTKRDLGPIGTFLIMGLFGLIIASIVNLFLGSSMMAFIINIVGLLIFAGLTAYDTQRIKNSYFMMQSGEMMAKGAIMGALNLYLDFINMFLFLLRFMGNRE